MATPQPEHFQSPVNFGLSPVEAELDPAGAESSNPANASSAGIGSLMPPNSSKSGASSIGGASLASGISGAGCAAFSASLPLA